MKKNKNERFQEEYYTKTLNNGLKVIIWSKPNYTNSVFCFATPFGGINLKEKTSDKEYNFHSGVAHFLEHKMFESENHQSVMDDFTRMGCNVNAFTSYQETVYYFSTTKKDFAEPLNLLLDFVQDFSISEKSVEKEKGIIIQEYKMYKQYPDFRLVMELFKSLYHSIGLKEDISGSEKDIKAITKDELETAHQLFYHPSKMILMVVSGNDPLSIMSIIESNQKGKTFIKTPKSTSVRFLEPVEVVRDKFKLKMELEQPKIALAYKFPIIKEEALDIIKQDLIVNLWIYAYFSSNNPDYQTWLDQKIINDSFNVSADFDIEYAFLVFTCDDLGNGFARYMENYLQKILRQPFDLDIFAQIKNRYIGNILQDLNSAFDIAINTIRYSWKDFQFLDVIDLLDSLNEKDIVNTMNSFDYSNKTIIEIK